MWHIVFIFGIGWFNTLSDIDVWMCLFIKWVYSSGSDLMVFLRVIDEMDWHYEICADLSEFRIFLLDFVIRHCHLQWPYLERMEWGQYLSKRNLIAIPQMKMIAYIKLFLDTKRIYNYRDDFLSTNSRNKKFKFCQNSFSLNP